MAKLSLIQILLSVSITAIAQIVLKMGMSDSSVQRALASDISFRTPLLVVSNPLVVTGLLLYFGAAVIWLIVLARVEVSLAYPFVALGFVLTAGIGRFWLDEPFSTAKVIGTLLICCGVIVLARD